MGFAWIPLAVGIQLILLYWVLGGPGMLLGRLAGQENIDSRGNLGLMHFGLPVALVLAFPSLVILAIIEHWVHQVGIVDVVLAQAAGLLLPMALLRRLSAETPTRQPAAADNPFAAAAASLDIVPPSTARDPQPSSLSAQSDKTTLAAAVPAVASTPATEANLAAIRQLEAAAPIVLTAGPDMAPVDPGAAYLNKLRKFYRWDDIGLGRDFAEARSTSPPRLLLDEHVAALGKEKLTALHALALATLAEIGGDTPEREISPLTAESVFDPLDYEQDVMRRLTYSAAYGNDRLFVDHADYELCGPASLLGMYRLALFTVHGNHPGPSRQIH